MGKEKFNFIIKFLIIIIFMIVMLISCEPISVTVNSKGEIAFTRNEGIFYMDYKNNKVVMLDWNYGMPTVPALIKWSPKGDALAVTIKDSKDSQETKLFLIDKNGSKKKIYEIGKIITQIEWSIDSNYICIAQAGEDSNMNIADLVLIDLKDNTATVIAQNTGDVHSWLDNNSLVFMKINAKDPKASTDIFSSDLSVYRVNSKKIEVLIKAFISRNGGIDCAPNKEEILFSAIEAGNDVKDFKENMSADAFGYLYKVKNNELKKTGEQIINFIQYSPDGTKILVKAKGDGSVINLGFFDMKTNSYNMLINDTVDSISANSTSVQVYPTWFDNNTILFWRLSKTYGSSGEAIQLMSMNLANSKKQNLQPFIDAEINKFVEAKGGY